MTTPNTPANLLQNNVHAIRTAIRSVDEVAFLSEALRIESGKDKPRSTVVGALTMRIDALSESEPEVDTSEDAWIGDEATEPEVETVEEPEATEPAPEPAPEPEVVEPTRTAEENCAAAFLAALKSGDAMLAAVMIAEVRRESADDAAMASALVSEFAKLAPARSSRRSGGRKSTVPSGASLDFAKANGFTLHFSRKVKGGEVYSATGAVDASGAVTVKAGARINPEHIRGSAAIAARKAEMIANGEILDGVLVADETFDSASAACVFVAGIRSNGTRYWKTIEGVTLRELCAVVETESAEE